MINGAVVGTTVIVPDHYSTIKAAVASIPNGGEIFIRNTGAVYYEDEIDVPARDIIIRGPGVTVAPNANSQIIFKMRDTDTPWGESWAKPTIKDLKLETRGHTGCTGIQIYECNNAVVDSVSIIGTNSSGVKSGSFPFTYGIQFDKAASGQFSEVSKLHNVYFEYCTIGIDAKATANILSLDHAIWDGITGNLQSSGDIGVYFESTVAHIAHANIHGHFWLKHATCTGWKIAGGLGKTRLFLGFEAFDASPVNRVGIELVAGCSIAFAELLWYDAEGPDSYFTKKIKGAEGFQFGKEMGRGINQLCDSSVVDAVFYSMVASTSTTTPIGHDHRVVGPMQFRGQAGELLFCGAVVYLKAADGKYWLADYNTEPESRVMAISDGAPSADQYDYFHVPPCMIRDDSWAWTTGAILYVGVDGVITPTPPAGTGDNVIVYGIAMKPTHVMVQSLTRVELS